MKVLLLTTFFCCLFLLEVNAQEIGRDCGFDYESETTPKSATFSRKINFLKRLPLDKVAGIRKLKLLPNGEYQIDTSYLAIGEMKIIMKEIPVVAHIAKRTDGTGGLKESDLIAAIELVNSTYNKFYINFTICSIQYIYSDQIYNYRHGLGAELVNPASRNVKGKLNIYFFPQVTNHGTWRPQSDQDKQHITMGNSGIVFSNTQSKYITLRHEIGHWLNLFHTHQFTEFGPSHAKAELVNGSNCDEAGDEVCDTPADPMANPENYSYCVYTGNERDRQNEIYKPMTRNAMSYYGNCRDTFTSEQIIRMHEALINIEETRGYKLKGCNDHDLKWNRLGNMSAQEISIGDDRIVYMIDENNIVRRLINEEWAILPSLTPVAGVIRADKIASNNNKFAIIDQTGKIKLYQASGIKINIPDMGIRAQDIALDKNGIIYAVTIAGRLKKLENNNWSNVECENVKKVATYSGRVLVLKTNGRIYEKQPDKWEELPLINAVDICMTNTNYCWVATSEGYVYGYSGESWERLADISADKITASMHKIFAIKTNGKIVFTEY
ncbi:MAG: hypothetical protein JST02_14795 [Bacteroidetes bacterium]|nr:hypothetical protein [Bacteroidota bacterium]